MGDAQSVCPKAQKEKAEAKPAEGYYLYTTATCPNCTGIKPLLEQAGIPFEERDVQQYINEAKALRLTQAPSLVARGKAPVIYAGAAQIRDFLDSIAR